MVIMSERTLGILISEYTKKCLMSPLMSKTIKRYTNYIKNEQ